MKVIVEFYLSKVKFVVKVANNVRRYVGEEMRTLTARWIREIRGDALALKHILRHLERGIGEPEAIGFFVLKARRIKGQSFNPGEKEE